MTPLLMDNSLLDNSPSGQLLYSYTYAIVSLAGGPFSFIYLFKNKKKTLALANSLSGKVVYWTTRVLNNSYICQLA